MTTRSISNVMSISIRRKAVSRWISPWKAHDVIGRLRRRGTVFARSLVQRRGVVFTQSLLQRRGVVYARSLLQRRGVVFARRAHGRCQGFQSLGVGVHASHSSRPEGRRSDRSPSGRGQERRYRVPGTEVPGNVRSPYGRRSAVHRQPRPDQTVTTLPANRELRTL